MFVAEKFIRTLVEKYGKHTAYTDGVHDIQNHVISGD
jgi:hypothetical protein